MNNHDSLEISKDRFRRHAGALGPQSLRLLLHLLSLVKNTSKQVVDGVAEHILV